MEQEEEECNATVNTQTLELPLSAGPEETLVYRNVMLEKCNAGE